jgi:hypothetical protein
MRKNKPLSERRPPRVDRLDTRKPPRSMSTEELVAFIERSRRGRTTYSIGELAEASTVPSDVIERLLGERPYLKDLWNIVAKRSSGGRIGGSSRYVN